MARYNDDRRENDYESDREGYESERRFRAGSHWDEMRRREERAPGRAHDDFRPQSRYGSAGSAHERHYDMNSPYYEGNSQPTGPFFSERIAGRPSDAGFTMQPKASSAGGFRGMGPKDYIRSDDRIREDVCDRLSDDDELDARGISIEVAEGEVTLNGYVLSRQARRAAEECAEMCSGVRYVQNNLRIGTGADDRKSERGASSKPAQSRTGTKEV